MANLIIDIGNTAVKAAWSEGMTIGKTFRYQGEKVKDFIISIIGNERPEVMVMSSVYSISLSDQIEYKKVCGKFLLLDNSHTQLLKEKNIPEYITCDRAASILAARYLFRGKGCTVIDFGTTLTIDFIDKEGNYKGGNISLGCRTRFKALNRYSRALPLVDLPEKIQVSGNTFESSISSGVVSGIMFEIDGYVCLYPDNIVIFTGGDANYFAKRIKNSIFVVCNLVLLGLALIADEYAKENK